MGGYEAPDNLAPFQCSLQLYTNHFCGCAIISSEYIVTAAHCFEQWVKLSILYFSIVHMNTRCISSKISTPLKRNTVSTVGMRSQIVTGTNELRSSTAARYNVSKIIIHERFNVSDYLNDIALIRTQSPIEFNERVQPINLTSQAVLPGTLLQTTGWGTLKVLVWILRLYLIYNWISTHRQMAHALKSCKY